MQFSLVKLSRLNEEFRIDAEYYSPEHLAKEQIASQRKHQLLGHICDLVAGPFGSTVTTENYDAASNKRYIRGKDIQSFFVDKTDAVFVEDDLFDSLPQLHLRKEDLLLTVVGMKFGKTAIMFPEDCPAIFSCKSTLIRNTTLNPYYLLAYLSSNIGYGLVRRGQRGAAQPGINLIDIRNIPVPLLTDNFQAKIESLIRESRDRLIRSHSVFADCETILLTELGLADWQPKHQLTFTKSFSEVQSGERMDAEYYQPKYGEIVDAIRAYAEGSALLGELVTVKKCVEVGSGGYLDKGIPFVRVSNLRSFEITEEKYISKKLYDQLKKHQPRKGEILLTKDGSPGLAYHIAQEPGKMIPSGGVLRLQIKDQGMDVDYLTVVLNSMITRQQIERDVGGSIILHWRPDQVKETLIPVLPERKQHMISKQVKEAFKLRNQSKKLLEAAKRAVELAIEEDEETAMEWLQNEKAGI